MDTTAADETMAEEVMLLIFLIIKRQKKSDKINIYIHVNLNIGHTLLCKYLYEVPFTSFRNNLLLKIRLISSFLLINLNNKYIF